MTICHVIKKIIIFVKKNCIMRMLKNMWWLWLAVAGFLVYKNWSSIKSMFGGKSENQTSAKEVDYTEEV